MSVENSGNQQSQIVLAEHIKELMESKGKNTWYSNSGNLLYAFNGDYLYTFTFSDSKLSNIEITDINVRDIKCLNISEYLYHVGLRITANKTVIKDLKELIEDNYLVNLPNYQQQDENTIKNFLFSYITESVYNTLFKSDLSDLDD